MNKKGKRKKTKNNKKKKKKIGKKSKGKKKKGENKTQSKQDICSSIQANYTCMEAALTSMLFEDNQIANYIKQAKLLERHQALSGNKAGKNDQFELATEHMIWAIGGNISNPKCGPNDTSSSSSKYNRYEGWSMKGL